MSDSIWFQDTSTTHPFEPKYDKMRFETIDEVKYILDRIHTRLEEKNTAYGDSSLNPIRLFSQADAIESLCVRIDDRINHIKTSGLKHTEDCIEDLIGYLVLLEIARKRKGA